MKDNQSEEKNLMTVSQVRYDGKEVHVYAPDFPSAEEWFFNNLRKGKLDFNHLQLDVDTDNAITIDKVVDIKSDKPEFIPGHTRPYADRLTKGYEPETGCYIFSMVNVYTREAKVVAASYEEAVQIAQQENAIFGGEDDGKLEVYACSENERVYEDGIIYKYYDEDELTDRLKQEFPEGLTVTLEDENLKDLISYKKLADDSELITLNGITSENRKMAGAKGKLEAKLLLKPDAYDILFACEDTYYTGVLSDMGWDVGANTTSTLLATESDMKDIRVQTHVCAELLDHLMIEGKPYHEVMQLIDRHDIKDDDMLLHHFNAEFLSEQPAWLQKWAEEQTKEAVNRYYLKNVAPVWTEQKQMFERTQEQAAKENGYKNAADWRRDVQWSKNPSPDLADRMRRTAERWKELYTPYRQHSDAVNSKFEQYSAGVKKAFIERFGRYAEKSLSDVSVIQRGIGGLAIRCRIDGEQQAGRTVSSEDAQVIKQSHGKDLNAMATLYFKDAILESMQQTRQQALKR